MQDDHLAQLDATAQAELVRRGDASPLDLVDAAIARIEAINPKINAVITPLFVAMPFVMWIGMLPPDLIILT
jgi:amidase